MEDIKKSLGAAVGESIRRRRTKLDLSQEELADIAGLHRTYIGAIERGERNITILSLHKISISLQTTVSEIAKSAEDLIAEKEQ